MGLYSSQVPTPRCYAAPHNIMIIKALRRRNGLVDGGVRINDNKINLFSLFGLFHYVHVNGKFRTCHSDYKQF
jgi:hypothetical protein